MPQAELHTRRISQLAGLLLLIIIAALAMSSWLVHSLPVPATGSGTGSGSRGAPRAWLAAGAAPLLSAPQTVRQQALQRQLARLHSAGWLDAAHSVAHIPIERAMVLLAQRGAPAAQATARAATAAATPTPTPKPANAIAAAAAAAASAAAKTGTGGRP